MKKYILFTLLILLTTFSLSSNLDKEKEDLIELVNAVENDTYYVERHVEESGLINLFRIEEVIKNKDYKYVEIYSGSDETYSWVRNAFGEYVLMDSEAFEPLFPIQDLEDSFLNFIRNEDYEITLSIDVPQGKKISISNDDEEYEVTYSEDYRLLKILKKHNHYEVSVTYKNYQEINETVGNQIKNVLFDKKIWRPSVKLQENFIKDFFSWASMDFVSSGETSQFIVYLLSENEGKMMLYLLVNGNVVDFEENFIKKNCNLNNFNYSKIILSQNSVIILIGLLEEERLNEILDEMISSS